MLDQVSALVQEVWVALEDPLAVELRYQCKVHNDVGSSAQSPAARSAEETARSNAPFQAAMRRRSGS